MAVRDVDIDEKLLAAARKEFLEKGFREASLRKIAASAGITTGAMYNRFSGKDALFESVVKGALTATEQKFRELRALYEKKFATGSLDALSGAIGAEAETITDLIFDYYEEYRLLICKSQGSRLEAFYDELVEMKIGLSREYLKQNQYHVDEDVLRILIYSEFERYRQIICMGLNKEKAKKVLQEIMKYSMCGWNALLRQGKED